MATDKRPAGYTISLFVSKTTPEHTETTSSGYAAQTSTVPRDTVELARIELRGTDLEAMLSDTKEHVDLIRVPA